MNDHQLCLNKQFDFSHLKPILIVEDTKVLSMLIIMQFNKKGIPNELANDGSEAVSLFLPGKYSLILMDCQMPIMDGYQAASKIREIENQHGATRIPIIALTADIMNGTKERCSESGMDDYLTKPVKLEHILDIINKWTMTSCESNSLS